MRSARALTVIVVATGIVARPARASAIIGGTVDPAPSSVVGISGQTSAGASGLVCTGTLVAPNVVLTARHCIEEGNPNCTDTFTGVAKYVSLSVTTDGGTHAVASTRVPTGTKPCGDDIALLVLSAPVPPSEGSPVADVRLTIAKGDETYSAVGYGWTCAEGGSACSAKGTRYRKDGLTVGCIDCREGTWRGTPDVSCVGDSGGPAFDADKRVFGVTSVGGLGCTTSYFTRLDAHADWLRATVRSESPTPVAWTNEPVDPPVDAGVATSDGGGAAGGATPASSSSASDEGCVVAPRSPASGASDASRAMSAFLALGVVLLTRACRRSTKRVRTTTSSANTTRTTGGRTIRTATTRSSTTSRSSS